MATLTKKKKAQMPEFNWLFAIIIGAVILFLAIYFAGRLIRTSGYKTSAVLLRNFDALLNPFASIGAVGEVESKPIKMPVETMVEFSCDSTELGRQGLRLRSKGSFGKWGEFAPEEGYYYIYDKYIYAAGLKGEKFCLLSKPFALPFRVDDVIYIIAQDYCFVDAPEKIKEELQVMNKSGCRFIEFKESKIGCKEGSKKVCFDGINCDINVKGVLCGEDEECEGAYNYGDVAYKDGEILPFVTDALLYAAIFSDSKTYECNLERLMYRLGLLCDIYNARTAKLSGRGCNMENIDSLITILHDKSIEVDMIDTTDMSELYTLAQDLAKRNYYLECPLF